jgi:type III secretory pathway lipoprotein EscJ
MRKKQIFDLNFLLPTISFSKIYHTMTTVVVCRITVNPSRNNEETVELAAAASIFLRYEAKV